MKNRPNLFLQLLSLVTIILVNFTNLVDAQNISEALFKNPPTICKPKTLMHAMSANMSKEGLTKDLEAMREAGLGGLLLFNITQRIPNGKIIYNSPEHHAMITHAAKEAERLGLSFGVHNCDGWSSSGGPWTKPEEAMRMIVWRYPPNDNYTFDATKAMPDWYVQNQPRPKGERQTFTTASFYKKDDALQPSGLLGEVALRFSKIVILKD